MKKNKKVKKVILILIAVLAILGIVAMIMLNRVKRSSEMSNERYTEEDVEIIQDEVTNYLSDKVTPQGMSRLYGKYKGDNELNDLYRKLYLFVNYLPTLSEDTKDFTDEQISKYYEENKSTIRSNLGASSAEELLSIIKYIRKTGYEKQAFSTCKILTDTFEEKDDYFTFDLTFSFDEFENEFKVKVHFANKITANSIVFYTVDE